MIDPGADEDINIELSKTFSGYAQTLLSILLREQICVFLFVGVVTVEVK